MFEQLVGFVTRSNQDSDHAMTLRTCSFPKFGRSMRKSMNKAWNPIMNFFRKPTWRDWVGASP